MNYVGLMLGITFVPVSWVLRTLSWCPTEFRLGCQMSEGLLMS